MPIRSAPRSPPASTSCARSRSACRRPRRPSSSAAAAAAGVVNAVCFNHALLRPEPERRRDWSPAARSARRGSSPGATTRTGCCSTPTGTGASTPRARARCAPSPTSARTGSTSCSSSPAGRIVAVFADLHTFVRRARPLRSARSRRSHAAAVDGDVARVREHMTSDDAAGVLLRFDDGARGACTVSQVSAGRKNTIDWELDGSQHALRVELRGSRAALDGPPRPHRTR